MIVVKHITRAQDDSLQLNSQRKHAHLRTFKLYMYTAKRSKVTTFHPHRFERGNVCNYVMVQQYRNSWSRMQEKPIEVSLPSIIFVIICEPMSGAVPAYMYHDYNHYGVGAALQHIHT